MVSGVKNFAEFSNRSIEVGKEGLVQEKHSKGGESRRYEANDETPFSLLLFF